MHPKWRRRTAFAVIVTAIAAVLAYGFRPQPQAVDVAAARSAPLRVTVDEEGRSRVIDRYVLYAPVAGYMRRLALEVGATVARGARVAEIEPLPSTVLDPRSRAEAEARVDAAAAELKAADQQAQAARAESELAGIELRRLSNLRAVNGTSQESVDQAAARARSAAATQRSAEFAVEVARHRLAAARTALAHSAAEGRPESGERVAISAPVAGRVLRIHRKSEGVVAAGEPLLELGDPHALEVIAEVLSADAVRIRPGMRVLLDRWGGEGLLEARVRAVEPVGFTKISALGVEEQRVVVVSDLVSPPELWEALGDGYRVEASFVLWEEGEVLQVPASALFRDADGWAVFVVAEGRAARRAVTLGRRNGLAAQVLSGLAGGEQVIVHPDEGIEDGAAVQVRGRG